MRKFQLTIIIAVFVLGHLCAQQTSFVTAKQYEERGLKAFAEKNYDLALGSLLNVLADNPDRSDLYFKVAESARLTRHNALADQYYSLYLKKFDWQSNPEAVFGYAMVCQSNNKYDKAIDNYVRFLSKKSNDSLASIARLQLANCKWALKQEAVKGYEIQHLDDKINTTFTDFAAIYDGTKLYYSSAHAKPLNDYVINIHSSNLQKKGLPIASVNSQTQGEHTAHYAVNTEGSRLYYTISKQLPDGNFLSEIYTRRKDNADSWVEAERLPNHVNLEGFNTTQPAIGYDNDRKVEVLYFVSNRPGGKGGLDIWASDLDAQGNFGKPYNVAAINTPADDITPFFLSNQQMLFFSSDGRDKSYGGFDIYSSTKIGGNFENITPLPMPINSSYDEIYYSFHQQSGKAFYTSNRLGGMCNSPDKDCICNDIYTYEIKVHLTAEILMAGTGQPLAGCRLQLYDLKDNKLIFDEKSFDPKKMMQLLDLEKEYKLVASRENFISDSVVFNSNNFLKSDTLHEILNLRSRSLKVEVYVFDKINNKPLDGASLEISSSSSKVLAFETLTNNSYTWDKAEFLNQYTIKGSKGGYGSDVETIVTEGVSSGKLVYRCSLYLAPFSGLPLTLYFDNDYPNPKSRATTTNLTYGETFGEYYNKESEYLYNFYRENAAISSWKSNEISDFFNDNIKGNYDKLNEFTQILYTYMQNGQRLQIELQGYASPLAQNDYNRNLTSRRISSVYNHFRQWNGGVLLSYLNSGQLRIKVNPFGEERADQTVSDSESDKRNSIYSVGAMKERKVEIVDISNQTESVSSSSESTTYVQGSSYWIDPSIGYIGMGFGSSDMSISSSSVGTSYTSSTSSSYTKNAKTSYQIVLVDAYSSEIIKQGNIDVYNADLGQKIGSAYRSKKGIFTYALNSESNYEFRAFASGYSEGALLRYGFYTEGGAVSGTDTIYLSPFNGLPLTLYYDNDRPMSAADALKSNKAYGQTYKEYYAKKNEFVRTNNRLLSGVGTLVGAFFEEDVKGNYQILTGYSAILERYLKLGYQLEIVVEGYASPLADSEYNMKLAARRVDAVIKYFERYGSLKKYIASGALKITVEPYGENTALGVSDNPADAASIYSLEASRERRVVLKDIIILNNSFYQK